MAYSLKGSHIVAILIAGGVIGWMATGEIIIGGQSGSPNATPPPAERASIETTIPKVRFSLAEAKMRDKTISLRGRTQANATINVRAETNGVVLNTHVVKGQRVNAGDLLCQLDQGARQSNIAEAKAALAQAEIDHNATIRLEKQGFATNTRLLALKAAKDAATARLEQAERNLAHTDITAQANGIAQDPIAQIGDLLNQGDICASIIQIDPMKFIGQISEKKIADVAVGNAAKVKLVSGQNVNGIISYISPSADPQTRTYRVEINIPNEDRQLRDGTTASAEIALKSEMAFEIKPSWLTLNNRGDVGVRIIGEDNLVDFVSVQILAQTTQSMWVDGLKQGQKIISLGQGYVSAGQKVIGVSETASNINQAIEGSNS